MAWLVAAGRGGRCGPALEPVDDRGDVLVRSSRARSSASSTIWSSTLPCRIRLPGPVRPALDEPPGSTTSISPPAARRNSRPHVVGDLHPRHVITVCRPPSYARSAACFRAIVVPSAAVTSGLRRNQGCNCAPGCGSVRSVFGAAASACAVCPRVIQCSTSTGLVRRCSAMTWSRCRASWWVHVAELFGGSTDQAASCSRISSEANRVTRGHLPRPRPPRDGKRRIAPVRPVVRCRSSSSGRLKISRRGLASKSVRSTRPGRAAQHVEEVDGFFFFLVFAPFFFFFFFFFDHSRRGLAHAAVVRAHRLTLRSARAPTTSVAERWSSGGELRAPGSA